MAEQERIASALGVSGAHWHQALMEASRSPSLPAAILGASAALKRPIPRVTESDREAVRARVEALYGPTAREETKPSEAGGPTWSRGAIQAAIDQGGQGLIRSGAILRMKEARESVRAPSRGANFAAPSSRRATPDAPGEPE